MDNVVRTVAAAVVVLALAASAVCDLASRTIPNACALAIACARVPAMLVEVDPAAAAGRSLAGAAAVFALLALAASTTLAYSGQRGVGAGDVKLLSALGLWAGPCGGLLLAGAACLLALAGRAARVALAAARGARALCAGRAGPMPLAPAIAVSAVMLRVLGVW